METITADLGILWSYVDRRVSRNYAVGKRSQNRLNCFNKVYHSFRGGEFLGKTTGISPISYRHSRNAASGAICSKIDPGECICISINIHPGPSIH